MTDYKTIYEQAVSLSDGVEYRTTVLANIAALLFDSMDRLNWAGFYLIDNDTLILGPFCGKPACTKIQVGRGVCGTSVKEEKTILVKNVHNFPGHIACDSASNSEIVVPIIVHDIVVGVLDIDSPFVSRFDEEDQRGLENIVSFLENRWEGLKLI